MFRRIFSILLLFAVFGLVVPDAPLTSGLFSVEQAHAQQRKKRKSLFDLLFKRKKNKKRPTAILKNPFKQKNKLTRKKKKLARKKKKRRTKPAIAKVIVVQKSENAGKILVVGDFIGGGLASGLEKLYASNPNFLIVNKTKANSGIVRDDVVDWPKKTAELIEELKPVAVITLVGMNDRQQMRLTSGRVNKLTDAWKAAYNIRVEAIAKTGSAGSLPFVWVGLPPVRSGAMNADYLVFNEIFREKTEAVGGAFIDVWDGFTNAEGKFVSAGPDIKGQIVRLRGSKGVNMTRAGKAKLAFYADKALRRLGVVQDLNQFFSSLNIPGSTTQITQPEYDPAGSGKTTVISLGGAGSDGGFILEGAKDYLKSKEAEKSVSYQLVEQGIGYAPRKGRVDAAWGNPAAKPSIPKNTTKPAGAKTSSLLITPILNPDQMIAN